MGQSENRAHASFTRSSPYRLAFTHSPPPPFPALWVRRFAWSLKPVVAEVAVVVVANTAQEGADAATNMAALVARTVRTTAAVDGDSMRARCCIFEGIYEMVPEETMQRARGYVGAASFCSSGTQVAIGLRSLVDSLCARFNTTLLAQIAVCQARLARRSCFCCFLGSPLCLAASLGCRLLEWERNTYIGRPTDCCLTFFLAMSLTRSL